MPQPEGIQADSFLPRLALIGSKPRVEPPRALFILEKLFSNALKLGRDPGMAETTESRAGIVVTQHEIVGSQAKPTENVAVIFSHHLSAAIVSSHCLTRIYSDTLGFTHTHIKSALESESLIHLSA